MQWVKNSAQGKAGKYHIFENDDNGAWYCRLSNYEGFALVAGPFEDFESARSYCEKEENS